MIKNSKKLVFHLNMLGHGETNPILLRINLFPEFTKIDFGYTTTNRYINGGWIKIASDTFIENVATKERFPMIKAEGITIAPAKHNFKSKKDWQYFSLYFSTIKQKDMTLNIIEKVKGNKHDFNYYNIELKIADGIEVI